MTARTKAGTAVAIAVAGLLVAPAAASAVPRFASPMGDDATSNCTTADPANNPTTGPCSLQRAVEMVAVDGDEVIVAAGNYNEGTDGLMITDGISVHGAAGQALPQILSSANTAVTVNHQSAVVRRLGIQHSGSAVGLGLSQWATAEQLIVRSTAGVNSACDMEFDSDALRDSVCLNTAPNGSGVRAFVISGNPTMNIRNVTAIGTGTGSYGVEMAVPNMMTSGTLVGRNVIADGAAADAEAAAGNNNATATLTLSNSNYATEAEDEAGTGVATVTNPGSATNQTAPPLFANAAMADFHQLAGSPTVNAGAVVDMMGTADLDGEPRTQGVLPDIGADEFFEPPTIPPAMNPTPAPLTPTTTPKKKCKKGKKLKRGKCVRKKRKRRR